MTFDFCERPSCSKCMGTDVKYTWHPTIAGSKEDVPDYLGLECARCHYLWTMPCADAAS